jgi:hypothetical protein
LCFQNKETRLIKEDRKKINDEGKGGKEERERDKRTKENKVGRKK